MPDSQFVDPGDVQGLILRGYHMDRVRHFTLRVKDLVEAKKFIKDILPEVTTAEEDVDNESTLYCLNIAFTFEGLMEIGRGDRCLEMQTEPTFKAFVEGAIERAGQVGDVGESRPEKWRGGPDRWKFHVMLSLYARTAALLEAKTKELKGKFDSGFTEVGDTDRIDGNKLDDADTFHFGFKDGIGQPIISEVPVRNLDDGKQSDSPPGAFLLGYLSQWKGYSYPPFNKKPPEPAEKLERFNSEQFWRNGSFLAFRMLEQDVAEFEAFLTKESMRTSLNRELIAAKIVGRWRNGNPLVLAPTADSTVPDAQLNNFEYSGDPEGRRCPFGAHIRRANPRDDSVASDAAGKHRIIRRGMPYGPPHDPHVPDSIERGLLGLFICVNLHDQFEFIMKNWINMSGFNGNLAPNHSDPLIGSNTAGGEFLIPGRDGDTTLELSQFVTTRGGAYCFLPSVTALRHIAELQTGEEYPQAYQDREEKDITSRVGAVMDQIFTDMTRLDNEMKKIAAEKGVNPNFEMGRRYESKRMVHPKSHGSVTGVFQVRPKLPDGFECGIFKPNERYDAKIRFSNADMVEIDDKEPDLRGMAIKLDIPKLGKEQDFLLVSHRVFFSRDPKDFLALATTLAGMFKLAADNKSYLTTKDFEREIRPYLVRRPKQARIFKQMQLDMKDPLTHQYWSQVPYQFGKGRAVKYTVIPTSPVPEIPEVDSKDRLRKALIAHLDRCEATFDFYVQLQTDPAAMPIEEAMVEWDEGLSPFLKIATLTIPIQAVTDNFESLSFRPWNIAHDDHRPLGGISRVRRAIYEYRAVKRGAKIPAGVSAASGT